MTREQTYPQFFPTSTAEVTPYDLVLIKGCVQFNIETAPFSPFYILYTILAMTLPDDHTAKRLLDKRLMAVLQDEMGRLPKNSNRLTFKELFSIQESLKLLSRLMIFIDFSELGLRNLIDRLQAALLKIANELTGYYEQSRREVGFGK